MENNLNEPKNIAGISGLLNDDEISSNIDLSELEKEIVNGISIETNDSSNEFNIANEYQKEMEKITRNYELNEGNEKTNRNTFGDNGFGDNGFGDNGFGDDDDGYEDNDEYDNRNDNINKINKNIYNSPVASYRDNRLNEMTDEQVKQVKINKVLNGIDDKGLEFNIEKEKDEDDKASLFEQIDMLKITLEDEGIDISGVPNVDKNSSTRDVQNVYKILRLKNDRNRYCSFAEELILAGAYGLEYVFDGKKEWFGRKPDLIGWPDTVKVKLRRMRYETSTFVQDVMQEYNMSSGVRLALELLPSMFLYSRNRRISQQDNLISDSEYKNAISDLNNI